MAQHRPGSSSGHGEGSFPEQLFRPRRSFDMSDRRGKGDEVLTRMELKLDEVNKGYLNFFTERIRIEETYINSLQKLYVSSRAFDSLFDDNLSAHSALSVHSHPPTTRLAWREVRDHTEREVECRRAFVEAMNASVLKVLAELGREQGRIRSRIKEDLKMATEMYTDQAEKEVPRLKKAYFRKCAEVEDQKRQDHAIEMQAKLLADPINPSNVTPLTSPMHDPPFQPAYPSNYVGPPSISDPLPPSSNPALVFLPPAPREREVPVLKPSGRGRSGSGSQPFGIGAGEKSREVFNDIALQSKRGINAFMSRLGGDKDKHSDDATQSGLGSSPPKPTGFTHSHSHSKSFGAGVAAPVAGGAMYRDNNPQNAKPSALKGVKLRREAEEADKAYREGIFQLESMRMRKNKVLVAANNSLDAFTAELCDKLRTTLTAYVDCASATATTSAQLCEHARHAVDTIDTSADLASFRGPIVSINSTFAAPVLYENFYVGPCKSLMFGVSLVNYDYQRGDGPLRGQPPMLVEKCIAELDRRGLDVEGIHRISGRQATVQSMMHEIEQDEDAYQFSDKDDIACVSAILKSYCRQLPEPVFNFPLPERLRYTGNRETHISSNFSAIRARLSRMPDIHQTTFRAIIEHLGKVAAYADVNKMSPKNLAVVFGKALFGEDELPKDGDLKSYAFGKDTALEDFITYATLLYSEETENAPGVLPAGAALTRAGSLSYHPTQSAGSGRTRIKLPSSASTSTSDLADEPVMDLFKPSPGQGVPPPLPARKRTQDSSLNTSMEAHEGQIVEMPQLVAVPEQAGLVTEPIVLAPVSPAEDEFVDAPEAQGDEGEVMHGEEQPNVKLEGQS